MTQTPDPSQTCETVSQDAEGEATAPAFEAYLPSEAPQERSRLPWVLLGLSAVLIVGGLVYWSTRPDSAEAENTPIDFRKMTVEQLAENASMEAAVELLRRQREGSRAERAAASKAIDRPRSARLTRNLAMAMALQQQNRANQMHVRMERERQMAERGY